jgi:hypothetical protein
MDLYNMPAAPPPPGVIPNFDNPPSLKGELLIINVAFTTVMAIFVAIRLISRSFITNQVGIDDCKWRRSFYQRQQLIPDRLLYHCCSKDRLSTMQKTFTNG